MHDGNTHVFLAHSGIRGILQSVQSANTIEICFLVEIQLIFTQVNKCQENIKFTVLWWLIILICHGVFRMWGVCSSEIRCGFGFYKCWILCVAVFVFVDERLDWIRAGATRRQPRHFYNDIPTIFSLHQTWHWLVQDANMSWTSLTTLRFEMKKHNNFSFVGPKSNFTQLKCEQPLVYFGTFGSMMGQIANSASNSGSVFWSFLRLKCFPNKCVVLWHCCNLGLKNNWPFSDHCQRLPGEKAKVGETSH